MSGDPVSGDPVSGEGQESTPEQRRALFRVVRGVPDDAELAALTAVLATAASEPAPEKPAGRSRWADPAARRRQPLRPGPGAWRSSGLPG